MLVARIVRSFRNATAALLLAALPATAAETPLKWETQRTTSPDSVDEMKALQARVKEVAKKVTPATVGLFVGKGVGQGAGSGVIVSDDGLVLTAAHVIGKPREPIVFVLSDGTHVNGISLGVTKADTIDSGMARITDKVPKSATWPGAKDGKWPFAEVGKSSNLKAGQWVVGMGHPGGPKPDRPPPVRVGRFLASRDYYLRSTARIVGGDSGGPLFDLDGRVIGIHSRIDPKQTDENSHVPVDTFRTDWARLARGDSIGRKSDAVLNLVFDDAAVGKVKVEEVTEGGAAEKAGIESGDVITKFADQPVKTPQDIRDMLSSYSPDEKVKVTILRGEETKTLELKLGKKTAPKM